VITALFLFHCIESLCPALNELTSIGGTGEYKDWFGSNDCKKCPLYMTSPEASVSLTQCRCQAGYSPALLHPSSLSSAPPNNTLCVGCELGTFKHEHGNSVCAPCPNGTYANASAMSACYSCPDGSTSESRHGISSAFDCHCKAGYYYQDANVSSTREDALPPACIACRPGMFKVRPCACDSLRSVCRRTAHGVCLYYGAPALSVPMRLQ
jgi:hypothetical protein